MAADLEKALATNIGEPIDPAIVSGILASPPFVQIDGVCNARDIGSDASTSWLRSGYVYRSATLENITEQGKKDIVALGIKTIFDLRSEREVSTFPDPAIEGVEVVIAALSATAGPTANAHIPPSVSFRSNLDCATLTTVSSPRCIWTCWRLTKRLGSW